MYKSATLFAGLLAAASALPAPAQDRPAAPQTGARDCYCTDGVGTRHEMGDIICIDIYGRRFLARCEMSLNVPTWRDLQTGCAGASLHDSRTAG